MPLDVDNLFSFAAELVGHDAAAVMFENIAQDMVARREYEERVAVDPDKCRNGSGAALYATVAEQRMETSVVQAVDALTAVCSDSAVLSATRQLVLAAFTAGVHRGARQVLRALSEKRFGPLSNPLEVGIELADAAALNAAFARLDNATTAEELLGPLTHSGVRRVR